VPNILSAYRLAVIPLLVFLIFRGARHAFAVLFLISLVTDILDGVIARVFRQQTALGARLDSYADLGTQLTAIFGVLRLEPAFVRAHWREIAIIVTAYLGPTAVGFLRFRQAPSLHLWSTKLAAYAFGIFFATYFFWGYLPPIFLAFLACMVFSGLEETAVILVLPALRSNVRGLYWVLKSPPPP
jgi:cardiolipin synthase (CMP-forming)